MKQIEEPIPGTENRVFMYLEPWNRVINIPSNWQAYFSGQLKPIEAFITQLPFDPFRHSPFPVHTHILP